MTVMNKKVTLCPQKLSLEDLSCVAFFNAEVVIDHSSLPQKPLDLPEVEPHSSSNLSLDALQLTENLPVSLPHFRALCLLQMNYLLIQKSGQYLEWAQFLQQILNSSLTTVPSFMGTSLLESIVLGKDPSFSQALAQAQIVIPLAQVSSKENLRFQNGPSLNMAMIACQTIGALGLVNLADVAAAVSCEALGTLKVSSLEQEFRHRGEATVANHLKLLLDQSKCLDKHSVNDNVLCSIPQCHGSARDVIETLVKTLTIELNTGKALSSASSLWVLSKAQCDAALELLYRSSQDRVNLFTSSNEISSDAVTNVVLDQTCVSLQSELEAAMAQIMALEAELASRCKDDVEKEAVNSSKAAEAAAEEDKKIAGMSEDKRKKIEAKRAKKAAQKAAKSKAKGSKDSLKLGMGTSVVIREILLPDFRIDPFDFRASSLLVKILELLAHLKSGGSRRKPKIAKGSQDFLPAQMHLRERIFNTIRSVFKRHGGVEIETPVFELKETLTGKYGEDSKLIYDLADQGGELLALRYDLTVPFARFMAMHNPGNIKRFHMARVYRRDNPQMARGRFREFYQCDFDIAGAYGDMIPDAEVLSVGIEIISAFPELGSFQVKLSHRKLLDAILCICGVPSDKFRTICSAIDKLDKESWDTVRAEMVHDKGLAPAVADNIEPFVLLKGHPQALHHQLTKTADKELFGTNADAAKALAELGLLFDYLEALGVLDFVVFDLSLARGLDYYTGLIYEFVLTNNDGHNVGSIAAGGRYDNLVGMFSVSGTQIPCVGVSIGIERIFGLLQAHAETQDAFEPAHAQVFVASTGKALLLERLSLCRMLWRENIATEIMQVESPKFTKQLHYALEHKIPFMVVIGEDELASGTVNIKNMQTKEEVSVPRDDVAKALFDRGCLATTQLVMI